jgi:hypothetical protein
VSTRKRQWRHSFGFQTAKKLKSSQSKFIIFLCSAKFGFLAFLWRDPEGLSKEKPKDDKKEKMIKIR